MTEALSGTKTVAASHSFDVSSLEDYLANHLVGFSGPLAVEQFKGGQSNPTYKLTTPGCAYVMRSKPGPAAKLLPSAHAIEREFSVMRALRDSAVPVPRVLLLCENENVIGRSFYVMEFLPGRVLWDQSIPSVDRASRGAIYDELNRVIAALHTVDVAEVGLGGFGKPGNYFERQIGRWTKQYLASVTLPIPQMDRLIEWLPANIPSSARNEHRASIVHGDYRIDNVMFDASEPRAIAVLDWELSTIGHPLADFSYHCVSWHIAPGQFRGIAGLDLDALGIPDEEHYVRTYCERTGRTGAGEGVDAVMNDWNFYLAYNLFRMSGILQGIAKRVEAGIATGEHARAAGASARTLAELGWKLAQEA